MHQPWEHLFEGQKVKSKGFDGMYVLVDPKTNYRVEVGTELTDFRGDKATLLGGEAPRKANSTGRVHVQDGNHKKWLYPNVFKLKWLKIED